MLHYNTENLSNDIKEKIEKRKLYGPIFIGQGLTQSVGSDRYGYYITDIHRSMKGKIIAGICYADSEFAESLYDGMMICKMPEPASAEQWITEFGVYKKGYLLGKTRYVYCDCDGNRNKPLTNALFDWNGASGYRDPNF